MCAMPTFVAEVVKILVKVTGYPLNIFTSAKL